MGDDSGNQNQSTSINQPLQGSEIPPVLNVVEPNIQPIQNFSQQPQVNQQPEVIQTSNEDKSRSGKKKIFIVLGSLILIFVLFMLGLIVLLTPTINGLSACMEENEIDMDLLFQKGVAERWNNQQKCAEIKPISEQLITCYQRVGDKNILPEQLAFTLGGLINRSVRNVDSESIIKQHNLNCSQYPETLIDNEGGIKNTTNLETNTKNEALVIYKPNYIISGFSEQEKIQTGTSETGETIYMIDYINQDGRSYGFMLVENSDLESLKCVKPEEGVNTVISDYKDFLPNNSIAGCSVTVGAETPNALRSHRWLIGNRKYLINSSGFFINESEALQIADSIQEYTIQSD
jgi:hypothetical protein